MNDIVRRDPRSEWIARNRLHPEHDAVLARMGGGAPAAQWMGPNGVIRRDPHAVGFIGPNGIRRIDRSGAQSAGAGGAARREAAAAPARRRVDIDTPAFFIAVVADMPGGRLSAHDRDLLGLARQLADAETDGAVLLVSFGDPRETGLGEAGVDRVLNFAGEQFEGYAPELRLTALGGVERQHAPRHWLFPDSPLGGAELGRRFAARLGERPATQVWQIADGRCTGRGAAGASDITRELPRIVLALPECAEPVADTVHAAEAIAPPAALPQALRRVEDLGAVAVDPAGVALAEAEFILSAGNGIHDWDGFHQAARVLGATEGASRVAVDNGFMPRHRQVGATGTWVTARVYLSAGISGAVQHLQGIQQCDKVVAINTDAGCDMVKRADLAVIADTGEVLAALVELVEGGRKEQRNAA
ncbi:electron transfer flavoprotein subunit alpha [Denitromonas iodatirespirans]|uniref:Electron transfer flavoprotein subunit alpha/FixB family protein n=1 Tax=Denitromonas iodatirespirans TaxID=2795389 RepID=A0A944DCD8_DENI1|nr:electron transfer flavoprotein subunit alpha/FixB family protein [Denitromonas iodatirespirans]MBT0961903.1 electron transfer flavoprotein subunit alpha/FixB family protein [Denitromonas iodatirespirans]